MSGIDKSEPGKSPGDHAETHQGDADVSPTITARRGDEHRKPAAKKFATQSNHKNHDRFEWMNFGLAALTLVVLTLTLFAAAVAAYQAYRLADLTRDLVVDARESSKQQTADTAESLRLTALTANAATKAAQAAGDTAAANQLLAQETHKLVESSAKSNAAAQRMVDTATKANAVASQMVNAAQKANETTRRTQRAFIFAKGAEIRKFTIGGPERVLTNSKELFWQAVLQWENSGNTPSKNLTITSTCLVTLKPVADPETVHEGDGNYIEAYSVLDQKLLIGPKQTNAAGFCLYTPNTLLGEQILDQQLYVYGFATYRDIINPEIPHLTEFCYRMQVETNDVDLLAHLKDKTLPPPIVPTAISTIPCPSHNCADDECSAQK